MKMNRIRKILKLRKQSDRVKVIFALVVSGIMFTCLALSKLTEINQILNIKIEYELEIPMNFDDSNLQTLAEMENVMAVSKEIAETVDLKLSDDIVTFKAAMLSKEYIEKVYGINDDYTMPVMYISDSGYDMLLNKMSGADDLGNLTIRYVMADEEKVAIIKKLNLHAGKANKDGNENEEAQIIMCADSYNLAHNATNIRLCLSKRNIDGSDIKSIEYAGYSISNDINYITEKYILNEMWLIARYRLIIGFASLFLAYLFYKCR